MRADRADRHWAPIGRPEGNSAPAVDHAQARPALLPQQGVDHTRDLALEAPEVVVHQGGWELLHVPLRLADQSISPPVALLLCRQQVMRSVDLDVQPQ